MSREIVAYQLSLLGEEAKPMGAWQPKFYQWNFCGIPVPPQEDEIRQNRLLYPKATSDGKLPIEATR